MSERPPRTRPLEILHDDDSFVAVNKPAGFSTVSERWDHQAPCLIDMLWDLWKQKDPEALKPHVVHRLDKQTSGVILFARNGSAQSHLRQQFMNREVQKRYGALVCDLPSPARGTSIFHVDENPARPGSMRFQSDGKECVTDYRVLEAFRDHSWVEASPSTGRTHQIRMVMAKLKTPCVCDPLYGDGESLFLSSFKKGYRSGKSTVERPLLDRLGLHALSISVLHPETGQPITIEAGFPKDLRATLRQLRRWSRV
jgi:23S rRNA pseudouridine955/2504/2580 synthase/23S rRNA pseudouridine1911/1915/1917 synthase